MADWTRRRHSAAVAMQAAARRWLARRCVQFVVAAIAIADKHLSAHLPCTPSSPPAPPMHATHQPPPPPARDAHHRPRPALPPSFTVGDGHIHYTHLFTYLGSILCSTLSDRPELGRRIGLATAAFNRLAKPILTAREVPPRVKALVYEALILAILLFAHAMSAKLHTHPTPDD